MERTILFTSFSILINWLKYSIQFGSKQYSILQKVHTFSCCVPVCWSILPILFKIYSDPWCSPSSSMTLVMELLRTHPYASLLTMPYSTDRSSRTRTTSNYKTTSIGWWTGPQHGVWNLTQQSATSCTSWPSTRRERHALPPTPWVLTLERVSDSKYLGVTLNEHPEWSTHTQITAGKAHTTLSFLERNLRVVPQHLRERAYLVIVRPALTRGILANIENGSTANNNTTNNNKNVLLIGTYCTNNDWEIMCFALG